MSRLETKIKIKKWEKNFIRDRWGNLINCAWNGIVKDEIKKLEKSLVD